MYRNRLIYHPKYRLALQNVLCKVRYIVTNEGTALRATYSHTKRSGGGVCQDQLHFNDGKLAMQSKSFREILRSVVILKLCKRSVFVDNSEKLINVFKKIFGKQLYEKIIQATFYKQFVAGEGESDVKWVAANLKKYNINCMFCVPTEDISSDVLLEDLSVKEDGYNSNLKLMLDCVDLTASFGVFAQSKITPIISAAIMYDVAELLNGYNLSSHNSRPSNLSVEMWAEALGGKCEEQLVPQLSNAFNVHIGKSLRRMDTLAKRAQEKDVKLMLDAEHSFIQASIDTVILALQKKYNQHTAVVYNTYQCYRKDTPARIESDIELAKKHNFKIACKLVRGAYMDFEQQRAAEFGYPSPICDTYEETGQNYKKGMDLILSMVSQGRGEVMFATHNEECILYGIKRMNELGIKPDSGTVCFGQLYGMCEHISYGLANAGYLVHKSVPYGTLDHSILYLLRRAQENKSVMARTAKETDILLREIRRRLFRPLGIAQT